MLSHRDGNVARLFCAYCVSRWTGAALQAGPIADLFIALMPGMIVIHHLYKPASATRLAEGMVAFAAAQPGGAKNSSATPSGSRKLNPEP